MLWCIFVANLWHVHAAYLSNRPLPVALYAYELSAYSCGWLLVLARSWHLVLIPGRSFSVLAAVPSIKKFLKYHMLCVPEFEVLYSIMIKWIHLEGINWFTIKWPSEMGDLQSGENGDFVCDKETSHSAGTGMALSKCHSLALHRRLSTDLEHSVFGLLVEPSCAITQG